MSIQFESTFKKHRNLVVNKINEGIFNKIINSIQSILLRDDDVRAKSYITPLKTLSDACSQVLQKIEEVEKYIGNNKEDLILRTGAQELKNLKDRAQEILGWITETLSQLEKRIKEDGNYSDINIRLRYKMIEKEFKDAISKLKMVLQMIYNKDQGEQPWEKWQSPARGNSPGKGPSRALKIASRF